MMEVDSILYHGSPGAAKLLAVEYRAGIKAAVMENVPPAVGVELRWADSLYPTLAGVAELAELRCAGLERVSTETRSKWGPQLCQRSKGEIGEIARYNPLVIVF